jgi:phytoene dehydrogenase-like protein
VTEEFHPGFRNSVAAYTVSLLNPQIIADLKLAEHGLRIVERRAQNFLPAPDGSYLLTGEGRTRESVAKLSQHDAAAIDAFSRELEAIADVLRQFVLRAPPNIVEGFGIGAIARLSTQWAPPASCASSRWISSAVCSTYSRAPLARCWTNVLKTIW